MEILVIPSPGTVGAGDGGRSGCLGMFFLSSISLCYGSRQNMGLCGDFLTQMNISDAFNSEAHTTLHG